LICYENRVANGEHNQTTDEFKKEQEYKLLIRLEKIKYTLREPFQYQSNKDKVKMVCSRGHDYEATYSHFMQGKKCRMCSYEDARLTEEQLHDELATLGYEYLGQYNGVNEPLKYRCTCGSIAYKRIGDLRRGQKCMRCAKSYSVEKRRSTRIKDLADYLK
jgi:hypothetical protein